jgi:hypothetical protein
MAQRSFPSGGAVRFYPIGDESMVGQSMGFLMIPMGRAMEDVQCPHCYSGVPYGAKVCRGCQAEVEYGMPPAAPIFVFLVSMFSAWYVGSVTHSIVGWLVLVGLLAGGIWGAGKLFRDRINFKRIYRTK